MPSTNKTPILGLNQWIDTDKPVREDFDRDNRLIEEKVAILSKAGATNWDSGNMIVESGTWTPTLAGTTIDGVPTFRFLKGGYYRQGSMVDVWFSFELASNGGMTGGFVIRGLPFLAAQGFSHYTPLNIGPFGGIDRTPGKTLTGGVLIDRNAIAFYNISDTGASGAVSAEKISNTAYMYAQLRYKING